MLFNEANRFSKGVNDFHHALPTVCVIAFQVLA